MLNELFRGHELVGLFVYISTGGCRRDAYVEVDELWATDKMERKRNITNTFIKSCWEIF